MNLPILFVFLFRKPLPWADEEPYFARALQAFRQWYLSTPHSNSQKDLQQNNQRQHLPLSRIHDAKNFVSHSTMSHSLHSTTKSGTVTKSESKPLSSPLHKHPISAECSKTHVDVTPETNAMQNNSKKNKIQGKKRASGMKQSSKSKSSVRKRNSSLAKRRVSDARHRATKSKRSHNKKKKSKGLNNSSLNATPAATHTATAVSLNQAQNVTNANPVVSYSQSHSQKYDQHGDHNPSRFDYQQPKRIDQQSQQPQQPRQFQQPQQPQQPQQHSINSGSRLGSIEFGSVSAESVESKLTKAIDLPQNTSSTFVKGEKVVVTRGSSSGLRGEVLCWLQEKQRWGVIMDNGSKLAIKTRDMMAADVRDANKMQQVAVDQSRPRADQRTRFQDSLRPFTPVLHPGMSSIAKSHVFSDGINSHVFSDGISMSKPNSSGMIASSMSSSPMLKNCQRRLMNHVSGLHVAARIQIAVRALPIKTKAPFFQLWQGSTLLQRSNAN